MQKKLSKLFVLTSLLAEEIDDPVLVPNKETKAIQDKARELQSLLLPIVDKFYQKKEVSRTTFFSTMEQKFNYIFNKEYK